MLEFIFILPAAASLMCAALALLTFTRNPRSVVNLSFASGLLCLTVIEAGSALILAAAGGDASGWMLSLGVAVFVSGQALLPVAWGVFSSVFSRAGSSKGLVRWAPAMLAAASVAIIFVIFNSALVDIKLSPGHGWGAAYDAEGVLYTITGYGQLLYVFMVITLAFNLVQLENTLRASRGTGRWRIKYIVLGVGAILAYFIYLSSHVLLFGFIDLQGVGVASAVVAISVAVIGVFIVKHRLLDVDIFISRYVVYNSVTIIIIGTYLLAAGVVAELIRYFGGPLHRFFGTIFVFAALLVLVVFLFNATVRRKFKAYINRHFYRHKYEFRDKWMETIERISSRRSVSEIVQTLREMVIETMGARSAHVWLYSARTREFACADREVPEDYWRIRDGHPIAAQVADTMAPFYFDSTATEGPEVREGPGLVEFINATGAVVCAPLVAGSDLVGFMLVGPDLSGETYVVDDFELLSAVTTEAAVQIRNIELARELMTVTELDLFNKMSYFIMHDLKNLTNSLSLISQNAGRNMDNPEFQKDAIETIDATVQRMKSLIERLSNVPRGVEVKKTPSDLSVIVQNTLKKIPINPKKNIEIGNMVGAPLPIAVDPEAMEMVVFNIVNNAAEAIEGTGKITLSAKNSGTGVALSITDDGPGMTEDFVRDGLFTPFRSTKKKGFGIGLYHCRAVVEAHGGRIEVRSAPGTGATFTIHLPSGT